MIRKFSFALPMESNMTPKNRSNGLNKHVRMMSCIIGDASAYFAPATSRTTKPGKQNTNNTSGISIATMFQQIFHIGTCQLLLPVLQTVWHSGGKQWHPAHWLEHL